MPKRKLLQAPIELYASAFILSNTYLNNKSPQIWDRYNEVLDLIRDFEKGNGNKTRIDEITKELNEKYPDYLTCSINPKKERK